MKKYFLSLLLGSLVLGVAAFAWTAEEKEDGVGTHFRLEEGTLRFTTKTENGEDRFFYTPGSLPVFDIVLAGEETETTLRVCRIDTVTPPEKWRELDISHLDLGDPEEIDRFVRHTEIYFAANPFPDVHESTQYHKSIAFLAAAGVIRGYDDGEYKPYNPINRAEFLKIVLEGFGQTPENMDEDQSCFSDTTGTWAAPYACLAQKNGYVQGYADGTFDPWEEINVADALKILRYIGEGEKLEAEEDQEWYAPYVADAEEKGYLVALEEDPVLYRLDRSEMAQMMVKYLDARLPAQHEKLREQGKLGKAEYMEEFRERIAQQQVTKENFARQDCLESHDYPIRFNDGVANFDLNTVADDFAHLAGVFSIYLLDSEEMSFSVRFFAVMNAGILLKESGDATFLWVFDLETGEPVREIEVMTQDIGRMDRYRTYSDNGGKGSYSYTTQYPDLFHADNTWGLPYYRGVYNGKGSSEYTLIGVSTLRNL